MPLDCKQIDMLIQANVLEALRKDTLSVAIAGNPNSGKTAFFNQLTGQRNKVSNFPGSTQKLTHAEIAAAGKTLQVWDMPGLYGFNKKEGADLDAQQFLLQKELDIIINIIDVTRLERSLFLTLELLELGKPMMVVLNFYDKISRSEDQYLDVKGLEEAMGVPVIPFIATHPADYGIISKTLEQLIDGKGISQSRLISLGKIEKHLDAVVEHFSEEDEQLQQLALEKGLSARFLVMLAVMNQDFLFEPDLLDKIHDFIDETERSPELEDPLQIMLISQHYDIIAGLLERYTFSEHSPSLYDRTWIMRLDGILLHNYLGFVVFVGVMAAMFTATFVLSSPISDFFQQLAVWASDYLLANISSELLASFLSDGLINGIGFVLSFIPQIGLLFIFLSLLEESGYLSRVVFITDRFLGKIGISGKSIAPMLLGFGCNVPAILATRGIEDEKERTTMVLINPYLACSARLPTFVIFASAVFERNPGLVVTAVYFIGVLLALLIIIISRKTYLRGESQDLILELVDLSRPSANSVLSQAGEQVKDFAKNASTLLALGLIVMWFLSVFGPDGFLGREALSNPTLLQQSWIYRIGNFFEPVFRPLGWDERLVVALFLGFIAKEIVVGSLGIIYGVGGNLVALQTALSADFTPLSAFAFMVFVLTYTPCIGTVIAIKNEIGRKWMAFSIISSLTIAYLLSSIIVLVGGLF